MPFGIKKFYTDDWGSYERHLPSGKHVIQQFPANPLLSEKQAVRKVLDLMCGEQDPRDMILI
jgi:hypothetical protein